MPIKNFDLDDLLGMKGFSMSVESPVRPNDNLSAGILNETFKMLGLNMDTLKREEVNE